MKHRVSRGASVARRTHLASVATMAAVVAAMTLTACGGSGSKSSGGTGNTKTAAQSPQQAVSTAINNLAKQSSIGLTFSLPLSASQVRQLQRSTSSTTLTAAQAQAITTGTIFLSVATGKGEPLDQAASDGSNSLDLGVTIDGNTPLELRYVDQALYAHLQASQLLSDIGESNSASASKAMSTLQGADQYVPGLAALAKGQWVQVSKQSLQSLQPLLHQLQQGSGNSSTSGTTLSPAQAKGTIAKIMGDLKSALTASTTFAEVGNSNGRTQYSATLNISSFVAAILPTLKSDLGSLPGAGSMLNGRLGTAQQSIPPGQTAVVDLYVSDDKLAEADLDVSQFMKKDKPSFPVPVRMAVDQPGPISAPSGAVPLDLSRLSTILGALGAGGSKQ